jgi:hypothetical protein
VAPFIFRVADSVAGVRVAERVAPTLFATTPEEDCFKGGPTMAKKRRRKSKRSETLRCNVIISSIRSRVSLSMRDANGPDPEVDSHCGLELRGTMSTPIRDVREVKFNLWVDADHRIGPNRPAYVGYITHLRPEVAVIASCRPRDFEYVWSLALSGHLTHAYMSFTKPHYNSASILSMSFSTELEE